MSFKLLWFSLGYCIALSLYANPSLAQSGNSPIPNNSAAGIDIPIEPAPEVPFEAAAPNPVAEELSLTVIEVLTQGMEQAIKGEEVIISPTVVTGIAEAIASQVDQAAQKDTAPQGMSEVAHAMRVAIDGGSETEVLTAVQEALTLLIGNISINQSAPENE